MFRHLYLDFYREAVSTACEVAQATALEQEAKMSIGEGELLERVVQCASVRCRKKRLCRSRS